ncbi:hypothetical protein MPH_02526 [Macrophomina phaseolina MS6]|uniref:Uncharacterized protein n=1 Tax=Macrophomina phaseolina (strain MS6) TaxID=1126212 RepID=K2SCN6_MACPH|nr:hypothetical protein MPH_02526 [Macrophomina phaseolina MS6]
MLFLLACRCIAILPKDPNIDKNEIGAKQANGRARGRASRGSHFQHHALQRFVPRHFHFAGTFNSPTFHTHCLLLPPSFFFFFSSFRANAVVSFTSRLKAEQRALRSRRWCCARGLRNLEHAYLTHTKSLFPPLTSFSFCQRLPQESIYQHFCKHRVFLLLQ